MGHFLKNLLKSVQSYRLHQTYVFDEADTQTEPTNNSFACHLVCKELSWFFLPEDGI
jgi:hypothetical protein